MLNTAAAKEFVVAIADTVYDVRLSQSGLRKSRRRIGDHRQRSIRQRLPQVVWRVRYCESRRITPTPRRGRKNTLRLRKARIGTHLKRHEYHVVDVTKPILSVSYLCGNGIEKKHTSRGNPS